MNNLSFRLVSSANKCFENTVVSTLSPLYGATAVKNDRFAFEAALSSTESRNVFLSLESELADFVTVRKIEYVDVAPALAMRIHRPDYLNGKKPGTLSRSAPAARSERPRYALSKPHGFVLDRSENSERRSSRTLSDYAFGKRRRRQNACKRDLGA